MITICKPLSFTFSPCTSTWLKPRIQNLFRDLILVHMKFTPLRLSMFVKTL